MKITPLGKVPLPERNVLNLQVHTIIDSLKQCQVGECILVDGVNVQVLQSRICTDARRRGISVSTRKSNGDGVRVWRTA